jgi:hypothetical protein
MREELNADAKMFERLDRDIDAASAPLRANLGIKEEMLEARILAKPDPR